MIRHSIITVGTLCVLPFASYADDLERLQQRVEQLEQQSLSSGYSRANSSTKNDGFNPAISLILDGRYANFDNEPEQYELPGFMLGNEAGLGEQGFSIGHTELGISASIDDKFYGQATVAIHEHEGETEIELEEAYVQTLGLGKGFTIKAGRFFSAIGYLNEQHEHAWDFADAPLIYRGLFGDQLRDDGVQISYVTSTDTYVKFGAEGFKGSRFPSSGDSENVGAWTTFMHIGGDMGASHSWMFGLSHWQADKVDGRESGGHNHDGEVTETPSFTGESKIDAASFVYKWAPLGNPKRKNFKLQLEYFDRKEAGDITLLNSDPLETTSYDGHQKGWYAQMIYQFVPQWRAGIRYDQLDSENTGSDADLLAEAGLDNEGHTPKRYSAMLEWVPSEFSRVRLQFNRDESYEQPDNQVFLHYTYSLGSHGAHRF
jgi:hypothetical protein